MDFETQLAWCRQNFPLTRSLIGDLPNSKGVRLAVSVHLDVKMVPLFEALLDHGLELFLVTCNPDTVRNEVVEAARRAGATVVAEKGMPKAALEASYQAALDWKPTHLCEMGAEIARRAGKHSSIKASLEGTGSGINRLKDLPLAFPVFDWDHVPVKSGLHNRYLVGLTSCHAFFQQTMLTFHGKRVLVVGFGPVGQGVCESARLFGGLVEVTEKNPARAVHAQSEGWNVVELNEGLRRADVVITATGCVNVVGEKQFPHLKPNSFLMNVGHASDEIDLTALASYRRERVLPHLERVFIDEKPVFLFAGGSMANLTAGQGDSVNAFDVTLGVMMAGLKFMLGESAGYSPGLYPLPESAWKVVAERALLKP